MKTKTKADETDVPGVKAIRAYDANNLRHVDVEVADVPGLGPIARRQAGARDPDGTPLFQYWHLDDDGKTLGPPISQPGGNPRGSDVALFERIRKEATVSRTLRGHLDGIDQAAREFSNFNQQWPEVAAALSAAGVALASPRSEVPAEFGDDGVLLIGRLRCAATALGDALARFARDDWGEFGRAGDHEISAIERWSLAIQPRAVKNAAVRADGRGVIVGRYPTPGRQPAASGYLYVAARWIGRPRTTPATSWAAWNPVGAGLFEE